MAHDAGQYKRRRCPRGCRREKTAILDNGPGKESGSMIDKAGGGSSGGFPRPSPAFLFPLR
ncbi:hypothetical protein BKK79_19595 [Cupriavidus sp. USMAA2-4]|uniref:Uncharacterized protein n=1 Tax=Cupriavidus malaysiensis TaxID=367825 RepID=A0ABM6F559_9BURK|nr:hypothetical protein BKK79_19595 [Cupriavidus sp. USMAA2-4]AOZ06581.1 hypothetical protein BKK80_12705 [Cupriavidus malaysiensis]